jgi:hypothetical protein
LCCQGPIRNHERTLKELGLKWKALVRRVTLILFHQNLLPESGLTASDYASYPTPQADTSAAYSWNCSNSGEPFHPGLNGPLRLVHIASSSYPNRRCRFCSQSEVLTSLFTQDCCRHGVRSFLSSRWLASTVSCAFAPEPNTQR